MGSRKLANKLYFHLLRDYPGLVSPVQQQLHRLAPPWPVVHRPLVYVHPDEGIGPLVADSAVELLGVSQRRRPMLQGVDDAGAEVPGNLGGDGGAEVAPNGISPKGKREPGV